MANVAAAAARRDCVSRRHHYVPRAYMKAWSPDGKRVRVLDTINGFDRLRGLRDTWVRDNFYHRQRHRWLVAGSALGPAVSGSRARPQPVPRREARGRPAARAVGCCPA
ncbi:DUF4238 domain-containing protein [Streptomyces galilaeus]|uniref:DUF4238 domain-containing protein n=1 Tax=Streptomyces galilaeus TaxID=33899 RepID=UPI0038F6BA20